MVRRTLVCQLDAKLERPELRSFKFNPIERVLEKPGTYIAAAITIARAYMAAGRPKATTVPLVGFDGWSKVVREPLIWLGEQDPVSSMEAARAADPSVRPHMNWYATGRIALELEQPSPLVPSFPQQTRQDFLSFARF